MNQQRLFFDDLADAVRSVVQTLGGYKAVGGKLWPEKAPDAAGRHLADCLNGAKAEKLGPEQLMFILRWARGAGYHDAMNYVAAQCGYEARPISDLDQTQMLLDRAQELARESRNVAEALDRLARVPLAAVK